MRRKQLFRLFWRVFAIVMLVLGLLIGALLGLTYAYQDKLVDLFINKANEYVTTPVHVDDITLSFFDKFPQASISFTNMVVQEAVPGSTDTLLSVGNLYCLIDLFDFAAGAYVVREIHLENADIHIKLLEDGGNNYTIWKTDTTSTEEETGGGDFAFQLQRVRLDNVAFAYTDLANAQSYGFHAQAMGAAMTAKGEVYDIALEGVARSRWITIGEEEYLKNKPLKVSAHVAWDNDKEEFKLYPSVITLANAEFISRGSYTMQAVGDLMDFSVEAQNANIQTLISLLPESTAKELNTYRSQGNVYFRGTLKGEVSGTRMPAIAFSFGAENASFYDPDLDKQLTNVQFKGRFTNGRRRNLSTTSLTLKPFSATLDGRPIEGSITLENLNDYRLDADLKAELDVASLLALYPVEEIESATGLLLADVQLKGRLDDLSKRETAQRISTSGQLAVQDLNLRLKNEDLSIDSLNGLFLFNNRDVSISDFRCQLGHSQLQFNGYFKDLISYVLVDDQVLQMEADFYAPFLDLDELLSGEESTGGEAAAEQTYGFSLPNDIVLFLNCKVDRFKFRRINATQIAGRLEMKDQMAWAKDWNIKAAGGSISANAFIDAQEPNAIDVKSTFELSKVAMDSAFYLLEDLDQDFLTHENIKGELDAKVLSYMRFDSTLVLDEPSMVVSTGFTLHNGQLLNFDPLQQASILIEEEALADIRFREITNTLLIRDETIIIPQMTIYSSITDIDIQGTQTFAGDLDYSLRVPVRNFKKVDSDEAFGAVEDDGLGKTNVYLTITGTIDDYAVDYDTKALRKRLSDNLKAEGRKLRDLFRNRGRKAPTRVELNEEEYFEWEDEGQE